MSETNLTSVQLQESKRLDKVIRFFRTIQDKMKSYKLNDVYILEVWDNYVSNTVEVELTHTGFPVKYKVVYISPEGIPHLRKLTGAGNPTGEVFFPPEAIILIELIKSGILDTPDFINKPINQRFTPDPEQLDAILLQTEFDPMAQHRNKSKLFNDINRHNKKVQIPTDYLSFNKIADFFKSRQPGDKFWTSPDKQYVFQSLVRQSKEWQITATDVNQTTVTFNFSSFRNKRLYRDKPRSYAKESNSL